LQNRRQRKRADYIWRYYRVQKPGGDLWTKSVDWDGDGHNLQVEKNLGRLANPQEALSDQMQWNLVDAAKI
jgi:hypothetical protein